ncbi:hypothetical protein ABIB85_004464 [Bradyrhizobium sp. JR1.5]|uniref:DUF4145 domain-containing protein n=1 Tax=unclassified Bradyrhizobium TaxID=2631580 RepID=UPI0033958C51
MADEPKNWTCPHCNRPQTLTAGQRRTRDVYLGQDNNKYGNLGFYIMVTACTNPDCRDLSVNAHLTTGEDMHSDFRSNNVIETYHLKPQGASKPQPDYIPKALRDDYFEACAIRDLSPKASATLARRCLQGMIRDYCGIAKSRLIDEIKDLRRQLDDHTAAKGVTHESVDAIDAVRSVGNIGAHMEKDVDLIVEIDPGEAQMLIDLIEMLFVDWYVERERRTRRLAEITALSAQKALELEEAKKAKLLAPPDAGLLLRGTAAAGWLTGDHFATCPGPKSEQGKMAIN